MASLPDLLKPSFIKNELDCLRMNDEMNRVIMAVGYPRTIKEGWLDRIVGSDGNFDLSIHISPAGIESVLTRLNHELVKQESDLLAAQSKGIVNPSLRIQREDTLRVLERLQKGEEKLFGVCLYLNARATSRERLELACRKMISELNSMMIIPKIPFMKMAEAVRSVMPMQQDKLRMVREITSDALSACFPFTTAFFDPQAEGVMLGFNMASGVPVVLDAYSLPNHNGLILGTSGGGKSVTAKLFIMRNLMRGVKTIIIDPQGEYAALVEKHGGKNVRLGGEGGQTINPLDQCGNEPEEKIVSVMAFLKILLGGIGAEQEVFVSNALAKIYAAQDSGTQKPPNEKDRAIRGMEDAAQKQHRAPKLGDLYRQIVSAKKSAGHPQKLALEQLEAKLRPFVGGAYSFLDRQTGIGLDGGLVCFDISQTPEKLRPAMMFLAMDFVRREMKDEGGRKMLVIDEAWSLLGIGECAEHIFGTIKTARKFGLSVVIITQEAEDLISTTAGKSILANTAWKFLARQEPAAIEGLAKKFRLGPEEKALLLTAMPGEGLLFSLNDHIPLKVVASPSEYELVTTNPEEIKRLREKAAGAGNSSASANSLPPNGEICAKGCGGEKNDAARQAFIRLLAEEVSRYTDNFSITGPQSGADIVFQAGEPEGGHGPVQYAAIWAAGNGGIDGEQAMQKITAGDYREIFIVSEQPAAGLKRPFSRVSLAQFRERLRKMF